jgi:hypothetical protein
MRKKVLKEGQRGLPHLNPYLRTRPRPSGNATDDFRRVRLFRHDCLRPKRRPTNHPLSADRSSVALSFFVDGRMRSRNRSQRVQSLDEKPGSNCRRQWMSITGGESGLRCDGGSRTTRIDSQGHGGFRGRCSDLASLHVDALQTGSNESSHTSTGVIEYSLIRLPICLVNCIRNDGSSYSNSNFCDAVRAAGEHRRSLEQRGSEH